MRKARRKRTRGLPGRSCEACIVVATSTDLPEEESCRRSWRYSDPPCRRGQLRYGTALERERAARGAGL